MKDCNRIAQWRRDSIIYIIDDDARTCDALGCLFQSVGLHSAAFGTAEEFLDVDISERATCIVIELRLAGLSGLECQAAIGRLGRRIPIIFLTAHGDIASAVKAMKGGAFDFLTKPYREQDLLDSVREALDQAHADRIAETETRELRQRYAALSEREKQVLGLVCAGLLNKQIALELGIAEITVKVHRQRIIEKLGTRSIPQLVRMAKSLGIPQPPDAFVYST